VAAHLEPEILIVDEVLAVGDAEFQKKAIGKMQDVSKGEGRTVLFVSHNMTSIKTLCKKAVVLENGSLKLIADAETAVGAYLKGYQAGESLIRFNTEHQYKDFRLEEIGIKARGKSFDVPISEEDEVEIHTRIFFKPNNKVQYHITYHLYNELGEAMFAFSNFKSPVSLTTGPNHVIATMPMGFLQSGTFFLSILVVKDKKIVEFFKRDIIHFTVAEGKRELGDYMGREPGYIMPKFEWQLR